MSEGAAMIMDIKSRPALADVRGGRFGAAGEAGIHITALPEGFLLHLLGKPFDAASEGAAAAIAGRLGTSLRKTAPGQWYVAGDRVLPAAEWHELVQLQAPTIAISDQSHGRVRIAVRGARVEAMLAKLVGADLAETVFPVTHGTTLYAGHVAVHAYRTASDGFEITVLRGFAVDLWESLVQAGAEYGVEAVGP